MDELNLRDWVVFDGGYDDYGDNADGSGQSNSRIEYYEGASA